MDLGPICWVFGEHVGQAGLVPYLAEPVPHSFDVRSIRGRYRAAQAKGATAGWGGLQTFRGQSRKLSMRLAGQA